MAFQAYWLEFEHEQTPKVELHARPTLLSQVPPLVQSSLYDTMNLVVVVVVVVVDVVDVEVVDVVTVVVADVVVLVVPSNTVVHSRVKEKCSLSR